MMRCSATGRVQTGHGSPSLEETGVSKTGSRFYAGSGTIPIQNMVLSRTSMSVYACQTFSASLRRVACQFGYRRCGRVARRRQVAEAVESSSHLTRRWREMDSNPRSLSQRVAFSGSHHAEFVDDHPSSFQIGEHSIRLQRIT